MSLCKVCSQPLKEGEKFCPNCGATLPTNLIPLQGAAHIETYVLPALDVAEPPAAAPPAGPQPRVGRKGRKPRVRTLVAGLFLLCIVAVMLLFLLLYPESPGKTQGYLNTALKTRGLDVSAKVASDGTATLTGVVQSGPDRESALAIVKSHARVKKIVDLIKVAPSRIETERTLNKVLDSLGLTAIEAQVDDNFRVLLTGIAPDEEKRILALKTVKAYPEVAMVQDSIRVRKGASSSSSDDGGATFTEVKRFTVSPLNPSSWASLKYRDALTFRVPGPGRILAEATWGPEGALALILNNADSGVSHAQKDGVSPLRLTYRVTPQDFQKGPAWEITIANFTVNGPRTGVLKITFMGGGTPGSGDRAVLEKELNTALRNAGLKDVAAGIGKDGIVTLKGSVRTREEKGMALAIAKRFKSLKGVKDIIFVVAS